jgi:small ligand-binding sensory domain FIST
VPFAAELSAHPGSAQALGEAVGQILDALGPQPDLAVLFVTEHHLPLIDELVATLHELLRPRALIGASAVAVLAGSRGVESRPGLALWAARMPGTIRTVYVTAEQTESGWRFDGLDPVDAQAASTLVLLPDPFTFPPDELLTALHAAHPHLQVIGGMASAGRQPGTNRLVVDDRVLRHGAVGVLLDQQASPTTVVSQGCRPIGQPYTVTRSERNLLQELGGKRALDRLLEIVDALDPAERELATNGLHCGIVVDERKLDFERGDFLVRNVIGADRASGVVAVGDHVPVGATVQFQVRDAATAGEDLREMLANAAGRSAGADVRGALVFTCNGRGTAMFGSADHDAEIVQDVLGVTATAGMFCAGELGPVAGRNALHGFTASVALFRD